MKGVNTMFTMTRSVPVNDRGDPDIPFLNRDQIWKGLELKAENALPFVPKMTECNTIERGDNYLVRDIVFRGDSARERVTFYPKRMVQFDRLSGNTLGTIKASSPFASSSISSLLVRRVFPARQHTCAS